MIQKGGAKLVKAEQLPKLRIPDPFELVKGEVVRLSPAGKRHGRIVGRVIRLIDSHAIRRKLGVVISADTGFYVHRDPDSVRAPDVAFISYDLLAQLDAESGTFYSRAPDLAVEVLSPDDSWSYVEEKVEEYLEAGAKAVWVVSPRAEKIHVYERGTSARILGAKDTLTGGAALPGFKCKVAAFFTDKPKKS